MTVFSFVAKSNGIRVKIHMEYQDTHKTYNFCFYSFCFLDNEMEKHCTQIYNALNLSLTHTHTRTDTHKQNLRNSPHFGLKCEADCIFLFSIPSQFLFVSDSLQKKKSSVWDTLENSSFIGFDREHLKTFFFLLTETKKVPKNTTTKMVSQKISRKKF